MLAAGGAILRDRYRLLEKVSSLDETEVWQATDEYDAPVLIKTWAFRGEHPEDWRRLLWDLELRNLFRLSSSPEAERRLVTLRDAGVDQPNRCLVLVSTAPGLVPLRSLLAERAAWPWLRDLQTDRVRADLWHAARSLAMGLSLLHEQQMLHRSVSTAAVFVDPQDGPATFRLGGFELAVRLGAELAPARAPGILRPPTGSSSTALATHSFETDWFAFGGLLADVFVSAPPSQDEDQRDRYAVVTDRIRESSVLHPIEQDLILHLLRAAPESRLTTVHAIISAMDEIVTRLSQPARISEDAYLALLVQLGPGQRLTAAIIEQDEEIKALDIEAQVGFVQEDVLDARIIRQLGTDHLYILQGDRLSYLIREYDDAPSGPRRPPARSQWDVAICTASAELRYSKGADDQTATIDLPIHVFPRTAMRRDANVVRWSAVPWKPYLPTDRETAGLQPYEEQQRFHEFFRITNQLEVLFRDAEIFPYEVISRRRQAGRDTIQIRERQTQRPPLEFATLQGGLAGHLRLQMAEKADGNLVYLGPEDELVLNDRVDRVHLWHIHRIDEDGTVSLRRPADAALRVLPDRGFLRTFELFGQVSLIRRRKRAIERLRSHNYLLTAILHPDFRYIDTGDTELPLPVLPADVDDAKRQALSNIWRTRPIFALQGPPGTGKTHLVAHLLGQIFADDPVAQVLITAQAHAAVDVLKEKVAKDIFPDGAEDSRPLAVRLSRTGRSAREEPDSDANVTFRMLCRAESSVRPTTKLTRRWLKTIKRAINELRTEAGGATSNSLVELVGRAANITYSTTTAGDLEALADTTQSFDWSIIEESGKAHGFDLALPLQTGHRWLLIGDQNQLPPYRYRDFERGLRHLDDVMHALQALPERGRHVVDQELIQNWRNYTDDERTEREDLWKRWLRFFAVLHQRCFEAVRAAPKKPVLADMLWQQHRMHPDIAGLISKAYYQGRIESLTEINGRPIERVLHQLAHPAKVRGRAIIWIDTPWVRDSGEGEVGPRQGRGRYTNPSETRAIVRLLSALALEDRSSQRLELAILAPYRLQVRELAHAVRHLDPGQLGWTHEGADELKVSTVDSFQGDQADVVIVSLVRNNDRDPGSGLGFLREAPRMNVLFSRAERLLVLVGSWEFFKHQLSGSVPDPLRELGHWRLALDYLEECFDNGKAALISVGALEPPS